MSPRVPKWTPKSIENGPRGGIKVEIRITIRKWLPGWPQSLKMNQNWYQKWANWGPRAPKLMPKSITIWPKRSTKGGCPKGFKMSPNLCPKIEVVTCFKSFRNFPVCFFRWERAKRSGARPFLLQCFYLLLLSWKLSCMLVSFPFLKRASRSHAKTGFFV